MLKIIKERERKEGIYYTYDFDRGDGSGFTFPCDENGNIEKEKMNEYGIFNYDYCLQHLEEFEWKGVKKHPYSYTEDAIGQCDCGEKFEIWSQYMGACQCPKCGKWYNLFGQELLPPDQWDKDYDY